MTQIQYKKKDADTIHRRMMDEKRKHSHYTDWTTIAAHKIANDFISKQRVLEAIEKEMIIANSLGPEGNTWGNSLYQLKKDLIEDETDDTHSEEQTISEQQLKDAVDYVLRNIGPDIEGDEATLFVGELYKRLGIEDETNSTHSKEVIKRVVDRVVDEMIEEGLLDDLTKDDT